MEVEMALAMLPALQRDTGDALVGSRRAPSDRSSPCARSIRQPLDRLTEIFAWTQGEVARAWRRAPHEETFPAIDPSILSSSGDKVTRTRRDESWRSSSRRSRETHRACDLAPGARPRRVPLHGDRGQIIASVKSADLLADIAKNMRKVATREETHCTISARSAPTSHVRELPGSGPWDVSP